MPLVTPMSTGGIPQKSETGDLKISAAEIATATRDTFINRTAIAPETYPQIFGTLLTYTEGVPTTVEYFRKRTAYIDSQTIDASFSLERSAVHSSFDLIHGFEIRIKDQLEISTDQETTETAITGVGITYSGFRPSVGDLFFMRLPDSNIGVFTVNLTTPLSIFRGTHYQIDFHLDGILTDETDRKLRATVSEELWFDKQHYLSDEVTLLTDTTYKQLDDLGHYRKGIISRLMNTFYNTREKTIIRPDGIYDPFLIDYLISKISVVDDRRDLCQLVNPYGGKYPNTIWSVFVNQDITRLMYIGFTLHKYQMYLFDVGISNLDIYPLVSLIDPNWPFDDGRLTQIKFSSTDSTYRSVNYLFSDRFYFTLLKTFEQAEPVTDVLEILPELGDDKRIYENLDSTFYSLTDDAYHSLDFFDTHTKGTGSNNDMHLPEIEYIVYDFIVNNNIDLQYLITKVLAKYPFNKMFPIDQLYTSAILLHLIDVSIRRIR